MALRGTIPESYITEHTLVYENLTFGAWAAARGREQVAGGCSARWLAKIFLTFSNLDH